MTQGLLADSFPAAIRLSHSLSLRAAFKRNPRLQTYASNEITTSGIHQSESQHEVSKTPGGNHFLVILRGGPYKQLTLASSQDIKSHAFSLWINQAFSQYDLFAPSFSSRTLNLDVTPKSANDAFRPAVIRSPCRNSTLVCVPYSMTKGSSRHSSSPARNPPTSKPHLFA